MSHTVANSPDRDDDPTALVGASACSEGGPGARLDSATLTVTDAPSPLRLRASWVLTEHVDTGEVAIWWRTPPPVEPNTGVRGSGGPRAAAEAERRARATLRRWCVRNEADRLATLTYAPEHLPEDRDGVWRDVERFRRRLRDQMGEAAPPVAAVIERGAGGRLHVHLALGGYVAKSVLAEAWGYGFVDVRKLKIAGRGRRERCRRAAAYLAKYVSKSSGSEADAERGFNRRRYSVTKGYSVVARSRVVESVGVALELAQALIGGSVCWSWCSSESEDWPGPPLIVAHFGDP